MRNELPTRDRRHRPGLPALLVVAALLSLLAVACNPAASGTPGGTTVSPLASPKTGGAVTPGMPQSGWIVVVRPGNDPNQIARDFGGSVRQTLSAQSNIYLMDLPDQAAAARMATDPRVNSVEPNRAVAPNRQ